MRILSVTDQSMVVEISRREAELIEGAVQQELEKPEYDPEDGYDKEAIAREGWSREELADVLEEIAEGATERAEMQAIHDLLQNRRLAWYTANDEEEGVEG